MSFSLPHRIMRRQHSVIALLLIAAPAAGAAGQGEKPPTKSAPEAHHKNAAVATGAVVSELDKAIWYIFQAKNKDYWFGSNDRGAYRFNGKTLVNFRVKDGLCSNQIRGIQEDKAGNIYFSTYAGISRFDGQSFTTLGVSASTDATDWKLQPEDLWFVGPPDAGVVFRFDGKSLHRLVFPKTKLGDEHFAKLPRSKFPNAKFNPYDVYVILKDSKGNLWFGTSNVGVCRYDGKEFHWLTEKALVTAPVRSIFEDKQGNYWFSYSGHGSLGGIRAVSDISKIQRGANGAIVDGMSIVEDDDGKIWTANYSAGPTRYDGKQKKQYPIKDDSTAITTFAIYKDKQGVLWVGTHNGGAYKFNGTTFEKFRP